jgi:hypothetical protein
MVMFIIEQAIKAQRRTSSTLSSTSALDEGGWLTPRLGRTLPPGKTRYPLYRRLGGPQGRSGQVRKISPPPGLDLRVSQPVISRYTDWAIPVTRIYGVCVCVCVCIYSCVYTGCPRRNVPDFGRVFLMLKYTDITQNTYIQSWTVTEIIAREKCGLLAGPRIVPASWQSDQCPSLSVASYDGNLASSRYVVILYQNARQPCYITVSCIVLGTLRTSMKSVRVFL